jgi:nucleoside-diphosphate-sugar epimerase
VESDLPGHEVFYIASPDNVGGRDLAAAVRAMHGDAVEVRPLSRPDASGISCAKAERLLGYRPTRSWRDHLTPEGEPLR